MRDARRGSWVDVDESSRIKFNSIRFDSMMGAGGKAGECVASAGEEADAWFWV
jgi:hypothetical protein